MIVVSVEQDGARLRVRTKYNARFVEAAREVPGMTWHKDSKSYIAYEHTLPLLAQRLNEHGLSHKISRRSSIQGEASRFKPMPIAAALTGPLRPYQVEGAQTLLSSPGYILDWGMRVGKGLAGGTPVLTTGGFVPVENLSVGDRLVDPACADRPSTVEGVFDRGVQDGYRFEFTDGASLLVDGDHLWEVTSPKTRAPHILSTLDLLRKGIFTSKRKNCFRWAVPLMDSPAVGIGPFGPLPLPIDPYVVGAMLGDGSLGAEVTFCKPDVSIATEIGHRLACVLIKKNSSRRGAGGTSWRFPRATHDALCFQLETLKLRGTDSYTKFVPSSYLSALKQERIDLLRGLMDTDGHVAAGRSVAEFSTSSAQLAEDVRRLVFELGGLATVSSRIPSYEYQGKQLDGEMNYRVWVRTPFNPFLRSPNVNRWRKPTLTRSIRSITPVGPIRSYCIKTTSKRETFVAGAGYIVTHNTPTGAIALASAIASGQVRTALVLYPGGVKPEWQRQFKKFSGGLDLTTLEGFTQLTEDEKAELIARPFLAIGCGYEILEGRVVNEQTGRPAQTKALRPDLREVLRARGKFVALADEIQMLQNRKAGRTMAAAELTRLPNCEARWGLTGTLQRNTPKNLWQPLDFIQPDGWGGYWSFAKRYCNPPEAPIWMGDFSFKPLGEVQIGDEVIGWKRVVGKRAKTDKHGRDQLVRAKVLSINRRRAPIVRVALASGREIRCTADHLWLAANKAAALGYGYLPPKVGRDLIHVVDIAEPEVLDERLAGWVGGMYDGEGSGAFISQSSAVNATTWWQLDHALRVLGIPHSMRRDTASSAGGAQILDGRAGFLRFLRICKPVRRSRWDQIILGGRFRKPDTVVSIQADGVGEVISMKTTTGNYVAWGYASKNCEAYEGEHGWVDEGSSNEEELNQRIRSFSSKLTRQDVAPWLPKSERTIQACSLTGAAMKTYAQQEKIVGGAAIAAIRSGGAADETALRQLASLTAPSKVEKLVERVRAHQAQGNKVVVFSHFHETLDVAEQALLKAGIAPHCAPGTKPVEQRKKRIEEWKADPTPAPLLVNTLSSGVGIDLADATAAIFLELSYVPADFLQAEARIQDVHLGKRTTPPLYEYLICRGTIDEDMGIALLSKLASIDRTVGVDDDARDVADTLRASGLINSGAAGLVDERESTIDSVIERLKARMRGEMSDPSASLAASVEAAFDEGVEENGDADDE